MKVTIKVSGGGIEVTDPETGNSVSWYRPTSFLALWWPLDRSDALLDQYQEARGRRSI